MTLCTKKADVSDADRDAMEAWKRFLDLPPDEVE